MFRSSLWRRVLLIMLLLQQLISNSSAKNNFTTLNMTISFVEARPPCDIRCKNGGTCYYISDNFSQLEYESQAGRPIQRCHCPPGFGGVACEVPSEECDTTTLTCAVSKRPCEAIPGSNAGHPMFTCACYVADTVGTGSGEDRSFAGRVCRKGYTEYCSSRYDPTAEKLYFCTNGGKCLADFLAARAAPGNTSANRDYEDAGCRCNTNFYGPHCEFLKLDDNLSHLGTTEKKENDEGDNNDTTGGGSYDESSSESNNDNDDEVSSVRSSGTQSDTVESASYRNKSAAFFAFIAFLGFMLILTAYLVVRRNYLVRRSRRRRALGGEASHQGIDAVGGAGCVLKVDGVFWDHESGLGAARVIVNGVDGYHGWNDSDHDDVSGLVRHVQEVDQDDDDDEYNGDGDNNEYNEHDDDEYNEDDNDEYNDDDDEYNEDDDEFFDDMGSVQHELVNQSNNKSEVVAAVVEPQNLINSEDQTTVFSQESDDDLVSKCHSADITVPASNTYSSSPSSRDSVSRREDNGGGGGGGAHSYSSSQELLSASADAASSPGSQDDSSEQEPDDNTFHLV